jgi:hypothetical protein
MHLVQHLELIRHLMQHLVQPPGLGLLMSLWFLCPVLHTMPFLSPPHGGQHGNGWGLL